MKTRDRILLCTLELFNEHGESNVTTLEIANELEISPGNLYYHFKGKEALLDALVDDFVLSTRSLLLSDDNPDDVEPEDLWLLLHLLFEAIATHRFLFQDLSNLMSRYPALRQQMQPWITALRQRLEQVLQLPLLHLEGVQVRVLAQTVHPPAERRDAGGDKVAALARDRQSTDRW